MALPPPTWVEMGHFTRFWSGSNYQQSCCTRPVAVGMLAHALRWWTLAAGGGAATGAFVACLVVGLTLAPVAHRRHMPFAAIGFASVVSMMPGVFLFRMSSGLLQLANSANTTLPLLSATVA